LARFGLPRFECKSKVSDPPALVIQPRYTSQARITPIALKQYTKQYGTSDNKLHSTARVGLASWLQTSLSGTVSFTLLPRGQKYSIVIGQVGKLLPMGLILHNGNVFNG
jgi:hypothetical protein